MTDGSLERKLEPANGTLERYKLQSWPIFVGTESAQGLQPAVQCRHTGRLQDHDHRQAAVAPEMGGWPAGRQAVPDGRSFFSVADPYLFTVTNWAPRVGVDISGLSNLAAFRECMAARPAVQAAMKDEGLLK